MPDADHTAPVGLQGYKVGKKMKVKCGGQQRLLMVMNSIIFLDRVD